MRPMRVTPVPLSARLCVLLPVLLLSCLVATGCDPDASGPPSTPRGAESPSASPGATTGPGSTPSPSPTPVEAAPRPPMGRDDAPGRRRFAAYVLQAWIYSLNTNDARPLLDVSGARPCTGCGQLRAELESRAEAGWYVDLEGVRVGRTRLRIQGRAVEASTSVSIPESTSYNQDGSFRSSNPAHPDSTFIVEMTWTRRGFRLLSFSLA